MTVNQSRWGLMDEFRHYWHGEGPLWKLYWIYGVLFSTIGGAFILGAVLQRALPVPLLILVLGLALIYTAYIQISVWRSAFNIESDPFGVERDAWGWIARVLTVGWALNAAGGSLMLLQFALGY
ncbi:hypothetical protein [Roseinatronobacter sp. S2]|uniref:hypothetical protein n=1 Tax=Roseinatronobacter sp. S2 TaxID=3035471 RepID=UPI002410AAA1|nr:hypothetical protein [Roseinatronobacter sp. S2]WFE77237.1 hypothetical protein P8S53_20500 [Roseinatronobacter sp. S2]